MQLIVITRPDFFPRETELVNSLFEQGLQRLHLRKPDATPEDMERWLQQIEPCFRRSIALHDHHALVDKWLLGGIHLNARNPQPPETWDANKGVLLSRSCHSLDELRTLSQDCAYAFLSPIFNSISKQGYAAQFSLEQLKGVQEEMPFFDKVFALGGVTPERVPALQETGFRGVAVLGDIWQHPNPVERMKEYLHLCNKSCSD
ncbi:MAG: thiamine phosphate synthase [Bacteroidales bacterium]|nr:thiamine phosphate synthase [Candidatus Physcousia equi]